MKHTIRVNDDTYLELQRLQRVRETYNEVITRLIRVYNTVFNVSELLGPSHYLRSDTPPQDNK